MLGATPIFRNGTRPNTIHSVRTVQLHLFQAWPFLECSSVDRTSTVFLGLWFGRVICLFLVEILQ